MVGWHHQLNGHEFEQAAGIGDGLEAWRAAVHGVTKSQPQLTNELILTATDINEMAAIGESIDRK